MRKIIRLTLGFMVLAVIASACSGETYAKRLKRQQKKIEQFIAEKGIKVLDAMPADEVFAENEYYKDPTTEIYFRIINKGSGQKPLKYTAGVNGGSRVYIRVDEAGVIKVDEEMTYDSNQSDTEPMVIEYGNTSSYTASAGFEYSYLSKGLALPLEYVRSGSEVSLIIPFTYGSYAQEYSFEPVYYGSVTYNYDEYQE